MRHALLAIVIIFSIPAQAAESWGYRFDGTGTYPDAKPPSSWDGKSGKNIAWKVDMPTYSHATPVVMGDRVITLTENYEVICCAVKDGKILWRADCSQWPFMPKAAAVEGQKLRAEFPFGLYPPHRGGDKSVKKQQEKKWKVLSSKYAEHGQRDMYFSQIGRSMATPVTDGSYVWVTFSNHVVACFDRAGKKRWAVWDHREHNAHDSRIKTWYHPSPRLVGDTLIVLGGRSPDEDGTDLGGWPLRLRAYDAKTGKKRWEVPYRHHRWCSGTPVVATVAGKPYLVGANGRVYDVTSGKVLLDDLTVCSGGCDPILDGDRPDTVYLTRRNSGGKASDPHLAAWRLEAKGSQLTSKRLWRIEGNYGSGRSGVYHDGLLYAIDHEGDALVVIDAATGKVLAKGPKPKADDTMTVAGGHLFLLHLKGAFEVYRLGKPPKQIFASNCSLPMAWQLAGKDHNDNPQYPTWEPKAAMPRNTKHYLQLFGRSFPAFAGNHMFVRSFDALWCVGR